MTTLLVPSVLLQQAARPEVSALWGVLVPAAVLAIAFVATFLLYRHFVRQSE